MAYSLLGHTFQLSSGGGAVTTGSVDTTGADLITIGVSSYSTSAMTITDSKSNTYTNKTDQSDTVHSYLGFVQAPTVGSGHTFTVGNAATFPVIFVAWWSGSVAMPFDQESGSGSGGLGSTTGAPGSLTPPEDNCLFVTVAGTNGGSPAFSIDSSFTITDQAGQSGGNAAGGAFAYFIQTTAGAKNPTWTQAAANFLPIRMATFKDTSGGGATTWGPLLGLHNNRLIITT